VIPAGAKKKPGRNRAYIFLALGILFDGNFPYQVFTGNFTHTGIILGNFPRVIFVGFSPGFLEFVILRLVGFQLAAVRKLDQGDVPQFVTDIVIGEGLQLSEGGLGHESK
jgi:hypothetical protein